MINSTLIEILRTFSGAEMIKFEDMIRISEIAELAEQKLKPKPFR